MHNLYRWPSKDASYQVSIHLAKRFQRRRFLKICQSETKNCLWWPCLLLDRDKISKIYRGPSIDASYQVSLHLAEGFQRRLKCEKLTDDIRQTMDAKWWQKLTLQGELKMGQQIPGQLTENKGKGDGVGVFNTTFNNISVIHLYRSGQEETRVPRENHRPVASHWQTLSHNVASSTPCLSGIRTHNVSCDKHWLHSRSLA